MFPLVHIGPAILQTAGLILLVGTWLGVWVMERNAHRLGVSGETLSNLVWAGLVIGGLGARLGYIAQHPAAFAGDLASIFSPNPALLDGWSGVFAGVFAGAIYGKRKGLHLWPTLDSLTPGLAIMGVAAGLAHFASGQAYGAVTALPWAIHLWGAMRHPTQAYEILAASVILLITWPRAGDAFFRLPGLRFLAFIALSSAAQLFIETFRGDSQLLPGGFRMMQLAAWVILAFSLWQIGKRKEITKDERTIRL
ncbi:MAG: prolipoprotein diacylglyceryl transferase [Chloroflexota bacterium]